jgi:predicted acylesterase/phospholipase RssA/CRP-like cAMP-binding protein
MALTPATIGSTQTFGQDLTDTMDDLAQRLAAVEMFAGLAASELETLAATATIVEVAAGATLVDQGSEAHAMFVVLDGRLTATFVDGTGHEQPLTEMTAGSIVGEIPFVTGGRRTATVRASEPSTVATVGARAIAELLETSPAVVARVSEVVSRRLRLVQLMTHLTALFPDVPTAVLQELGGTVEWVSLAAGETLFRQGDVGDAAYLIVVGRVRVMAEDPESHGERVIGEIGSGEFVGDQAVLLDTPRSETVYAGRDTDLARIPRAIFARFVERHPDLMLRMMRSIVERARNPLRRIATRTRPRTSITLVGLDPDAIEAFERPLVAELEKLGSVIALSSASADAALCKPGIAQSGPPDPAHIRLRQWLHEMENAHHFVVYRADVHSTAWTEQAVRQSDHVVLCARASSDPSLRPIESVRHPVSAGRRLALLHARATERPVGTARWLGARDVESVHHLREDDPTTFARLARHLAGRAIGLVLGGGGARGFAHLGVIRALEELGVPVDVIGGASMGAAVAMPTAQGQRAAEATATLKHYFRGLLDYTLPVVSLLAGRRITGVIQEFSGSWDIEDLWLTYYCVSSSMTTARTVVHRRGNLARASRASVAIPGVLPPVVEGDELLVDGGVLNNLPLDVMREINPTGPVIAVHVVAQNGPRAKSDFGLALSGWSLMANRWLPWGRRVAAPSLVTTILRSMFVGAEAKVTTMLEAGLADLYLNINASIVGLLEFDTVEKVAQLGYEAALDPIREWLAAGEATVAHNKALG